MALAVGRSTDIRFKVEWPRAINAFLKNLPLGTGYSSITLATDNDYLRMLGETGLLGFLAFFAFMIAIWEKFWLFLKGKVASKEDKLLVLGIVGANISYFLNAAFIDVLEASKIAFFFWILTGVGLKIVDLSQFKTKREG
jgi:O-antigen ligase